MTAFSIKVRFYVKSALKMESMWDIDIKKLTAEEEIVIVVIHKL